MILCCPNPGRFSLSSSARSFDLSGRGDSVQSAFGVSGWLSSSPSCFTSPLFSLSDSSLSGGAVEGRDSTPGPGVGGFD